MVYQIDQSGRIEQTSLITFLALTQKEKQCSVVLNKKNKRILQLYFRSQKKTRMFTLLTFSSLVAILIKKARLDQDIVLIDHEYKSDEDFVKKCILQYLLKLGDKKVPKIRFGHIGKTSSAHELAAQVAHRKKKADKAVSLREVVELVVSSTKKIGNPVIGGIEGNVTQDWLPGGRKPSRSKKE